MRIGSPLAKTPEPVPSSREESHARIHDLWSTRTQNGVPNDFCLGPGDLIEITVFHFPEMSGRRARVSSTGFVALPLLGEVQVAGLTEHEVEERIATGLRNGFMKNPQVTVFVNEHTSQQVSVTGAVSRPGLVALSRDNRSVADIISEAGGLTEQSAGKVLIHPAKGSGGCEAAGDNNKRVQLVSARPPTALNPIEVDLNEDYDPPDENPLNLPVIGGDAIVVSRGRFLVDGWVRSPGAFDITSGMSAYGAVSAAGGTLFPADLGGVIIWRSERNGGKKRIDVDLAAIESGHEKDVTLEPGDVVSVPASILLMIPYSVYWTMINVVRFGAGVTLI